MGDRPRRRREGWWKAWSFDRLIEALFGVFVLLMILMGVGLLLLLAVSGIAWLVGRVAGGVLGSSTSTAALVAVATTIYTVTTVWVALETRWSRQAQQDLADAQDDAEGRAKVDSANLARIADALARVTAHLPPPPAP